MIEANLQLPVELWTVNVLKVHARSLIFKHIQVSVAVALAPPQLRLRRRHRRRRARRTVRHQCYYRARATIHSHTSTSIVKQSARCTDLTLTFILWRLNRDGEGAPTGLHGDHHHETRVSTVRSVQHVGTTTGMTPLLILLQC